jgi:GT2 family glycosyltransferase
MPSVVDNSPFGVYECLASGLPFMASKIGGIPELVAEECHREALFSLQPTELAERLYSALQNGAVVPKASFDFRENSETWLRWHQQWLSAERRRTFGQPSQAPAKVQPKVSVCVTHHDRPQYLKQALQSLEQQTYANFEVVVVDDGSERAETQSCLDELEPVFAGRGWTLIRSPNRFVSAARNTAAANASGEYLIFMDDDNIAKPDEIARFVEVSQTGDFDILTCFADVFAGDGAPPAEGGAREKITPIGSDASTGMFRNVFGDVNALIKKSAFEDLGGFKEDYKVGKEDQELFARAVLAGQTLEVLPEALYWYRQSEQRVRHIHYSESTGELRIAETYLEHVPAMLRPMVLYAARNSRIRPGAASAPARAQMVDTSSLTDVALTMLQNYPRLGRMARFVFRLEMRAFAGMLHFQSLLARKAIKVLRGVKAMAHPRHE